MSRITSSGYQPARVDFMGVRRVAAQGVEAVEHHAEPFARHKLVSNLPRVRVDMSGMRVIIAAALAVACFDQLGIGSCEANAAIGAMTILKPGAPLLSRRHLYLVALMVDGQWPNDAGTNAETIQHALANEGVCLETSCPYTDVDGEWQKRPSLVALEEGYDHRLDASFRITSNGDELVRDLCASIDAGRPVQNGGPCSKAYEKFFEDLHDTPTAFRSMMPSIGGHARAFVGYWIRPDGSVWFLERNSWGVSGGDAEFPGHVWISQDCLHQYDECFSYYAA